jgi:hyaluronan synthase
MRFLNKKILNNKEVEDVLLELRNDRRLLSNVPDKSNIRSNVDRRGGDKQASMNINDYISQKQAGMRYKIDYDIQVIYTKDSVKYDLHCKGIDISMTGILLNIVGEEQVENLKSAENILLKFEIKPGSLPEGMEMKVKMNAKVARVLKLEDSSYYLGFVFEKELSVYSAKKKDRYMLIISSFLLFVITSFIVLMRAESIIYFKFNKWLYLYSIVAAIFLLTRYLFGAFYRVEPIDADFTPGVTILIPCFNEEEWIQRTILSCINQDYPVDKLEVIVIDDCSHDKSVEKIEEIIHKLHQEADQFATKSRLKYIVQEKNAGKREALAKGALDAKHELVVFVDSDSFLDPFAIRNLVQPFKDPKMGGVSGRTDVANTYTNILTKMQSVRYYIAFRIMKAAEAYFDAVTCLSGPLACYKKQIILDNMDNWLNQSFLGQKATFGDDRAMTNFVLAKYRTTYQDSAVCQTIVPNKYKVFLKQQMRWKRSWLRESLLAGKFMYKKEPFASFTFYLGLIVPIAAPIVVLYNLVYVPIVHQVFPTAFLLGLLLMSLLMSVAQLLLRKSSTWIFGLVFCLFYEAVLLWQMPVAWVTFWKSTWGTRMTPSDVEASERKKAKEQKKKNRKVI